MYTHRVPKGGPLKPKLYELNAEMLVITRHLLNALYGQNSLFWHQKD